MFQGLRIAIVVGTMPISSLRWLAKNLQVWAPDLPQNVIVRERLRSIDKEESLKLFNANLLHTPEAQLLEWLPKVTESHRDWTILEVHGVKLTDAIESMLGEINPSLISSTSFGFIVTRVANRGLNMVSLANLYDHTVELLGKYHDGPELAEFMRLIGRPTDIGSTRTSKFFYYWDLGFSITSISGVIAMATFCHDTASIRSGREAKYSGYLPAGIQWTDTCKQAEEKLGRSPESVGWVRGCQSESCDEISRASDFWQHYEIPPFHYTLIFRNEKDGLGLLAVRPSKMSKSNIGSKK